MSEKKQGPGPSYPQAPPTSKGHNVPYPMQQGPSMPPQGAPPAYTPMPPQGHMGYPQQPYYPANAGPQPYPAYGQPPHGYPPQCQPGPYPTHPGMPGAYQPGAYPPGAYPPGYPPGAPAAYPAPPGQVVVPGLFDAGARFDGTAQPNIPPPPPGYAPNAAQMATMQGHQVTGTQQRSNFFTTGAGGTVGFGNPFK
ncbi:DAZ-associated protein 2-like isoform X3 [Littorina saxatilis]|uniref:DAZ-associated protein 2-like isoform X3 n=1 Tax=Littorina saxatilis TaxID=31220 RepID=UPI0038B58183